MSTVSDRATGAKCGDDVDRFGEFLLAYTSF
jgi:hypothetical protein